MREIQNLGLTCPFMEGYKDNNQLPTRFPPTESMGSLTFVNWIMGNTNANQCAVKCGVDANVLSI